MKRAVITGTASFPASVITSRKSRHLCVKDAQDHFSQELKDSGMRSHVWGNVKLDTTGLIDRKVVRFMSDASIYAFLSMEQAIACCLAPRKLIRTTHVWA